MELSHGIKTVKETLRKIPNKGVDYSIIKYLTKPVNRESISFQLHPEIRFNYLGQFDADDEEGEFTVSDLPTGEEISPLATNKYLLDINGMVINGKLELHFSYNNHAHHQETIEELVKRYQHHLLEIMKHCLKQQGTEWTPSDFSAEDLTYDDLEEIYEILDEI